jgi:PKD repeat protein
MNKLYDTFENQLREKMSGHEMQYDPQHWNALQHSLRPKGRSTSVVVVALLATMTVIGSAGLITFQTLNHSSNAKLASNKDLGYSTNNNTAASEYTASTENALNADPAQIAATPSSSNGTTGFVTNAQSSSSDSVYQLSTSSSANTSEQISNATPNTETIASPKKKLAFAPSVSIACAGTEIDFQVTSLPDGVKGNYIWNFGDGKFKAETAPSNTYSKPGEYDVSLSITDDNGRITTTVMNKAIVIVPAPKPEFSWHFTNENPATPTIQITNSSANANSAEWKLYNGTQSSDINPTFALDSKGKHMVALNVKNEYGCSGGTIKHVVVNSELDLKAPAELKLSKTTFMPELLQSNKYNFVLTIYDNNGQKVYQTSNRNKGWDGNLPSGQMAKGGEQFQWKVIITNDLTKEEKYFNGTLNIIP